MKFLSRNPTNTSDFNLSPGTFHVESERGIFPLESSTLNRHVSGVDRVGFRTWSGVGFGVSLIGCCYGFRLVFCWSFQVVSEVWFKVRVVIWVGFWVGCGVVFRDGVSGSVFGWCFG